MEWEEQRAYAVREKEREMGREREKWDEGEADRQTAACLKYEVYENFLRGLSEICRKINGMLVRTL
jgi:hypothetical protein